MANDFEFVALKNSAGSYTECQNKDMLERLFKLSENQTTARTEILAGITTFLTMAYILVVQPAVLSGSMFGMQTGMDFGAVMTATCLSALGAVDSKVDL